MRGFIRTIPIDSGSNNLVLDSLRYVSDTDFYTGHLCFAALLPHYLPLHAPTLPWTSTLNWATWEVVWCMGRHTYAPGPRWYVEEGGEMSPPPLMMRHVARVAGHHLCTPPVHPVGTCHLLWLGVAAYQRAKAHLPMNDALPFGWPPLLGQSVMPGHAVWCGTLLPRLRHMISTLPPRKVT